MFRATARTYAISLICVMGSPLKVTGSLSASLPKFNLPARRSKRLKFESIEKISFNLNPARQGSDCYESS